MTSDPIGIAAAVATEHRLGGIEAKLDVIYQSIVALTLRVGEQNGRLAKTESKIEETVNWIKLHEAEIANRDMWGRMQKIEADVLEIHQVRRDIRVGGNILRSQWTALLTGGGIVGTIIGVLATLGWI